MSGIVRHRQRHVLRYCIVALVAAALTATLAVAVQVRRVQVSGTHLFPAREVEAALASVLGERVIATSAEELRLRALGVPWVADAVVRLSLDGTVTCQLTERQPVAVAVDAGTRELVDGGGTLLGNHQPPTPLLELRGFAPCPGERVSVLAAVPEIERFWGGRLVGIERVGSHDVLLEFAETPFAVLADPFEVALLAPARAVTAAFTVKAGAAPQRVDARVPGRVAILPAPTPEPAGEGEV